MTDLTDRMRTCAAALLLEKIYREDGEVPLAMRDAADLLIEASNTLEAVPEPLGEPMEILPETKVVAKPSDTPIVGVPHAVWTSGLDTLPAGKPSPRPNRVCPQCDSRAVKRVYREGRLLMLACPVCAAAWEYKP